MTTGLPHEHPPGDQRDAGAKDAPRGRPVPPSMWLVIALAVVGIVVYLLIDHWPHVLAALPYVGIIVVVGMHLFGHGGHGGHGGRSGAGAHAGHGGTSAPGGPGGASGEGRGPE